MPCLCSRVRRAANGCRFGPLAPRINLLSLPRYIVARPRCTPRLLRIIPATIQSVRLGIYIRGLLLSPLFNVARIPCSISGMAPGCAYMPHERRQEFIPARFSFRTGVSRRICRSSPELCGRRRRSRQSALFIKKGSEMESRSPWCFEALSFAGNRLPMLPNWTKFLIRR